MTAAILKFLTCTKSTMNSVATEVESQSYMCELFCRIFIWQSARIGDHQIQLTIGATECLSLHCHRLAALGLVLGLTLHLILALTLPYLYVSISAQWATAITAISYSALVIADSTNLLILYYNYTYHYYQLIIITSFAVLSFVHFQFRQHVPYNTHTHTKCHT